MDVQSVSGWRPVTMALMPSTMARRTLGDERERQRVGVVARGAAGRRRRVALSVERVVDAARPERREQFFGAPEWSAHVVEDAEQLFDAVGRDHARFGAGIARQVVPGHPPARRPRVPVAALANERLMVPSRGLPHRGASDVKLRELRIQPAGDGELDS